MEETVISEESNPPKVIDREDAINRLIDARLENWDSNDFDETLRSGRYGYAEFPNSELVELWSAFFEEAITITGEEPPSQIEIPLAEYEALKKAASEIKASIYIVHRDSADGPEVDVFTDSGLAEEWAQHIKSSVCEEYIIDKNTLDDMKESYEQPEE